MTAERKSTVHHYLESSEHLVFCAPWFRREGLCLFIYNDQDLAVAAASEKARLFGYDIDLGETDDVIGFLNRMAGLGFAGAVLNDLVPVIFCRKADGTPAVLRSLQNQEGGFSHFERLLDDGTWDVSGVGDDILPLRDQKRFDRLIAGLVGEIPFRGYSDDWKPMTWSDVNTGEMPIIDAAEGAAGGRADALRGSSYLPIFSSFDFLEQFAEQRDIDPATVRRRDVEDLAGLTKLAADSKALVLLNPGQHRADTAALGWREQGVALTSFSGRWFSTDGQRFRPGSGVPSAGQKSSGPPRTLAEELARRREEKRTAAAGEPAAIEPQGDEPEMVPGIDLDTSRDEVELTVSGEQVASETVNHALSCLCSAFKDPETLHWAGGRFHFRFTGVEQGEDPFTVPEIRLWLRSLDRLLPVLAYFLSEREGGQKDVARALLDTSAEGEGDAPEASSVVEYVEDRSLMILAMGEKYSVETRPACEAFARTFSHQLPKHFLLAPDSFSGQN